MIKLFLKVLACAGLAGGMSASIASSRGNTGAVLLFSWGVALTVIFVIPFIYGKIASAMRNARYERDARQASIDRANSEEYAHQTALRRERERLEMLTEMRIKELIATLEIQFLADAKKMEQLGKMKAEFAKRQQADIASLLARLEAMKAGL